MGPGSLNKNSAPGLLNTNWGPGPVNTNWEPGPVKTIRGPGPVNTNWGPGSRTRARARVGGQTKGWGLENTNTRRKDIWQILNVA